MEWTPDGGFCLHSDVVGPALLMPGVSEQSMFQVVDTTPCTEGLLRTPADRTTTLGLLVWLDAAQVSSPPVERGATVCVHRPDGSSVERRVSGTEFRRGTVGLFFVDTPRSEIPIHSQIEILPG